MESALSSDVKSISQTFDDPNFSDIEVHVGEKVFRVNKYFLQLHSDVFLAYFCNDSLEKRDGIVKITDLDSNLVDQMLRFMYGMKVENLDGIAHDLFVVADKYNVKRLMELCLNSIKNNITISTLQKCLDLSGQLNLSDLEEKCINFIVNEIKSKKSEEEMKAILDQNAEVGWKVIGKFREELEKANKHIIDVQAQENQQREQNRQNVFAFDLSDDSDSSDSSDGSDGSDSSDDSDGSDDSDDSDNSDNDLGPDVEMDEFENGDDGQEGQEGPEGQDLLFGMDGRVVLLPQNNNVGRQEIGQMGHEMRQGIIQEMGQQIGQVMEQQYINMLNRHVQDFSGLPFLHFGNF